MMGCKGPKSGIEIFKKSKATTIFEVKVQQIEVPIINRKTIHNNSCYYSSSSWLIINAY